MVSTTKSLPSLVTFIQAPIHPSIHPPEYNESGQGGPRTALMVVNHTGKKTWHPPVNDLCNVTPRVEFAQTLKYISFQFSSGTWISSLSFKLHKLHKHWCILLLKAKHIQKLKHMVHFIFIFGSWTSPHIFFILFLVVGHHHKALRLPLVDIFMSHIFPDF